MTVRRTFLSVTAVLGLSAFLAGGVRAQEAAPGAAKQTKQAQRAKGKRQPAYIRAVNALNLTDEQKPKVKAITDKYQADLKALRAQNLEKEQATTKQRELTKKMRTDVEAILTAEQKAQLKKGMQKNNAARKQGGKQGEKAGATTPAPNANP